MKFEDFKTLVQNWSHDRGIYIHSTSQAQFIKAVEEIGEMAGNLSRGKDITDDLADTIVCLINVAYLEDVNFADSFDHVWNEIKDRKGHMIPGGAFVKDSDNEN